MVRSTGTVYAVVCNQTLLCCVLVLGNLGKLREDGHGVRDIWGAGCGTVVLGGGWWCLVGSAVWGGWDEGLVLGALGQGGLDCVRVMEYGLCIWDRMRGFGMGWCLRDHGGLCVVRGT